jgi:hypothetical protein
MSEMKTYRGVVVAKFYQEITVDAHSEDEAEQLMEAKFDLHRADCVTEVYDLEEV